MVDGLPAETSSRFRPWAALYDVADIFHIRSAFGVTMCVKALLGHFPHLRSLSKSTPHRRLQETIDT